MIESLQFYVGGKWVDPVRPATLDVYNPATEDMEEEPLDSNTSETTRMV